MSTPLSRLLNARAVDIADTPAADFSFLPAGPTFPLVLSPGLPGLILMEWIRDNRTIFEEKLKRHGALLCRGFGVNTVEKFRECMNIFETAPLVYRQRSSPRFEVARNIYHSTTYPADQAIDMHSENSYAPEQVRTIVFCCIRPADEQGETPIADNRLVAKYLSAGTRAKFLQRGVRYIRQVSKDIGLSWQEIFQTSDRQEVEEECIRTQTSFAWGEDDRLTLSWNKQALIPHPDTGEEVWFNHAFFFNKYALSEEVRSTFASDDDLPFNTCYGDGSEISPAEIAEIREAYKMAAIRFPWEKGDVLFLDNLLMSHGRSPFKGDRQIIVAMF